MKKTDAAPLPIQMQHERGCSGLCRLLVVVAMVGFLGDAGSVMAQPAAQGQQIAARGSSSGVPACAGCHGAKGEGNAVFPRLAGTGQGYLLAQLDAFASGARTSAVMQPFAQKLTAAQRSAVASYYSGLPAPAMPAHSVAPSPLDPGSWLATRGRWTDQLPACAQCHGPGGLGVGTNFPPLTGLSASYISAQLNAWKTGTRPPGPLALMPAIAHKLSDADITAVADYYTGLAAAPGGRPVPAASSTVPASSPVPPAAAVMNASFSPPPEASMPAGEYGKVVRLGEQIFTDTGKYAGRYVGNSLNCASCHLDAGRKPDSAPLWAAFIHYPAYRSKTGQVDTLAARIQGCFEYSMNGKAPPQNGEIITALQTYAFWLAKGAPVGTAVAGSGYPKLKKPALPADYVRGEAVYRQNCALCHGAAGQGQRSGGKQVFPPLWGPKSFNWGAGMHQIHNAAGFIQANMPLGKGGTLSDQDAWDVATFMDSHERPQDPRYTGSVEVTRKKYHDSDDSMYGRSVNGHVLGSPD